MEVRAAGYEQVVFNGEREEFLLQLGGVIRVIDLDGVQTCIHERSHDHRLFGDAGVRHGRQSTGSVNLIDDRGRTLTHPRHERRLSGAEKSIEGFLKRCDVTRGNESASNDWSADGSAGRVHGAVNQRLDVHSSAQACQAGTDLPHAIDPTSALLPQECIERDVFGVNEIPEHVHVATFVNGSDFNAVDQLDSMSVCGAPDLGKSCDGIVIGDAHHGDARGMHARNELAGSETSVGCSCMEMEIDQRGCGAN